MRNLTIIFIVILTACLAVTYQLSINKSEAGKVNEAIPVGIKDSLREEKKPAVSVGGSVGQRFIDFSLQDEAGKVHVVSEVLAGRKGFIYFYSGCCGDCRLKLPKVAEFANKLNEKDIAVIGIQYLGDKICLLSKQDHADIKGLRITDAGGEICQKYGIGDFMIIATDKNGIIQYRGGIGNPDQLQRLLMN